MSEAVLRGIEHARVTLVAAVPRLLAAPPRTDSVLLLVDKKGRLTPYTGTGGPSVVREVVDRCRARAAISLCHFEHANGFRVAELLSYYPRNHFAENCLFVMDESDGDLLALDMAQLGVDRPLEDWLCEVLYESATGVANLPTV